MTGEAMGSGESSKVEKTLQKPDVHTSWENAYRTPQNDRFYDMALDRVADMLGPPEGGLLLDAGCGICDYSIRLARRGFKVVAVDFSESVLENAARRLRQGGVEDRVKLQRENLLSISFDDESFDNILCWGVLMHIPDVEQAISELCRVLKKGGRLAVSEGNMHSLEAVTLRAAKRFMGRQKEDVVRVPAGMEYWWASGGDRLVTRESDVGWLKAEFAKGGCRVREHVAGQFTELYARVSSRPLQDVFHGINRSWFNHVRSPRLAFGNIIVFEKEA